MLKREDEHEDKKPEADAKAAETTKDLSDEQLAAVAGGRARVRLAEEPGTASSRGPK